MSVSDELQNLESIYYLLGLIVVSAYAWQRFDEPSFRNKDTLPQVLEPLRYLFLGPTYRKARLTYLVVSLVLYSLLVLPGPGIVAALKPLGANDTNFPVQVWALAVIPWTRTSNPISLELIIALTSATAAGFMYGFATFNALHRRSAQIEDKVWVQSSPRCYISIAIAAGFVSWLIIVASTLFWNATRTVSSAI